MKSFTFVFSFVKGLKLRYLAAIFCIILAASFSFLNPLVVRFVIDGAFGGKAPGFPISLLSNPQ